MQKSIKIVLCQCVGIKKVPRDATPGGGGQDHGQKRRFDHNGAMIIYTLRRDCSSHFYRLYDYFLWSVSVAVCPAASVAIVSSGGGGFFATLPQLCKCCRFFDLHHRGAGTIPPCGCSCGAGSALGICQPVKYCPHLRPLAVPVTWLLYAPSVPIHQYRWLYSPAIYQG